ncbi:MAG TPA: tRNA epoxyqueuosine(34) reductase QueG [candidate division Zixibacteria bacterium]|nr:tRNA epoxyqueuosine(34) reductase QueG [candidate division Zixibacteria bacterium]
MRTSTRALAELAARHGLELVGVTDASPLPEDRARMEESAAAGRMARMGWMGGRRPATATDPRAHDPAARSVIVVAAPYDCGRAAWDPRPNALHDALAPVLRATPAEPAGRIARYALGTDYHSALRARLEALAADLRAHGLPAGEVAYVDDRPLAERALAAQAGLGWIGKNTNLLTHAPAGSWVFLGALLTSAELPMSEPVRTSCGSCTRCLTGCPTGALIGPRIIDARRCISYLTIEHPGVLGEWEAQAIGDWIFGCDVCQEVCPVNADADDPGALRVPLLPLIAWLLPMGSRAFERAVGETAIRRAGRHRLLRNAIAALANAGPMSPGARALLQRAANDRREEVRQQARMALAH